jgi:hypothetical protein
LFFVCVKGSRQLDAMSPAAEERRISREGQPGPVDAWEHGLAALKERRDYQCVEEHNHNGDRSGACKRIELRGARCAAATRKAMIAAATRRTRRVFADAQGSIAHCFTLRERAR